MIGKALSILVAFAVMGAALCSNAADAKDPAADLQDLVTRVRGKLRDDKRTEEALAPELKEFDSLLEKYKENKTDDVAEILFMKGMLYEQVLQDPAKAESIMTQLKKDFPSSKAADRIKKQEQAKKVQASLKEGAAFPDFNEKDLEGKALSIANYKGKIVLLDFWATWCGPCVAELPNVLATYGKHHSAGFEIIGISLDQDREKLNSFLAKNKMTWQQYFDGKGWENKLASTYGIQAIPATFLLDKTGKIIGKDLRGDDLEPAVARALKANP